MLLASVVLAGSVAVTSLSPVQTQNLATLGKVWGFVKYHHPNVVRGSVDIDQALFRVLPEVLAAGDRVQAQRAMLAWVKALGEVKPCDPCTTLPAELAMRPDLDWLSDRELLGEPLSRRLLDIHRNRLPRGNQAYVRMTIGVGNPDFRSEHDYATPVLPDVEKRILALFRWWNVVQYWSPNRDVIGSDWNAVLPEFLPRLVAASDVERYRLEMLAAIARMNDGHANLWRNLTVRPPRGDCRVPAQIRYVEEQPVVSKTYGATPLTPGDAIVTVDGTALDALIAPWKPYYSASNDPARMAAIASELTEGVCGPVTLGIERGGRRLDVKTERRPKTRIASTHDLPGPAFRRLSPEVAYLKLSEVKIAEIPEYLREAEGSTGWIIDIRNYPAEFVVFPLGGHFVSEPTPFVQFTLGDTANPGAFLWMETPLALRPVAPRYAGRLVILVDEVSLSQAEYTAMALRVSPGAIVVGSTTQGADGDVSRVPLPGGLSSPISGIGVFYPNRRPTQRIGIVPDVEARPTIAGLREGRDEALEAAIRVIVPSSMPESRIREIAKP